MTRACSGIFLHLGQIVRAAIAKLYADAGYDSAENRDLCLQHGIQPYYPQDWRSTRLGTGQDPQRGRARLRMVAGQQETGPAQAFLAA